jgi:uncharacterized protein (DUF1330 family)
MPKGYWIARVDVHDAEVYKDYVAANAIAFSKFGARFLTRGGKIAAVDGDHRQRNVIIEFPTFDAALACWNSPEYQHAYKLRAKASIGDTVIVEGYDGPQPNAA